jgi:hypothetical protein
MESGRADRMFRLLICLTGKSVRFAELPLSSPLAKNISLSPSGKSSLQARPVPTR